MTNPEDLQEVIARGQAARELSNSPIFLEAVNDLSSFYLGQMAACPTTDASLPALRNAHLMHVALAEIVSQLHGYAAVGEATERQLAEKLGEEDELND